MLASIPHQLVTFQKTTARPRLVRMTGPEKNRTNQKRTIYLLKPKITLKSAKTRAK